MPPVSGTKIIIDSKVYQRKEILSIKEAKKRRSHQYEKARQRD
jgi:hypothetical protein